MEIVSMTKASMILDITAMLETSYLHSMHRMSLKEIKMMWEQLDTMKKMLRNMRIIQEKIIKELRRQGHDV